MNFLILLFSIQVLVLIVGVTRIVPKNLMTSVLRFSYAVFLLFSGFVKLIDPLGFSYKLQEYFEVFSMEFLIPFSLFLAIFIILFELFLGLFLIYGIQIKKVMWGNLVLMLFFTFLTFFSAYFNKVTDCGCFGDFMKLDPWNSFFKDIYLLFISIVLFLLQSRIKPIFNFHSIRRLLIINLLVLLFIPIYTLSHIPFFDFRAYKIGTNIIQDRQLPQDAKKDIYKDVWYYEVDGEVQEFLTEEEPWKIKGAVFKDRKSELISKGDEPPIHDFDIIDEYNNIDMTDSILAMEEVFLVISYDIEKASIKGYSKLNKFIATVVDTDIPIYGLSSSSISEIDIKLPFNELNYPYFLVDQITLKTMIRANPGIFFLKNGIVVNKWHWRDLPETVSLIVN